MEQRVTLGYMDQAPGEWGRGKVLVAFILNLPPWALVLGIWNAWINLYYFYIWVSLSWFQN